MKLKERVRQGASDRLALGGVLCAAVFAFSGIDWLKTHIGENFLKFIVLGLGLMAAALMAFTLLKLKASGIKPPAWRELRGAGGATEQTSEATADAQQEPTKEKGGQ
ncbi:MAG: hypothetical protein DI537_05495 [Stutzerimonas stutzeri]|nr:MAG: hypothetical protein DI537_05495 [Stutzerimonas stutzeri]